MSPETSAAKAQLGRWSLSDEAIGGDFRRLATALDARPLADAMRSYIEGEIARADHAGAEHCLSSFGVGAIAQVDFLAIAADFQRITQRFGRSHMTTEPRPFRLFR